MNNYVYFILIVFLLISCKTMKTRVLQLEYKGKNCIDEKITRVYMNDSIFVDYTTEILSSNETVIKTDTFKSINDSLWYVKRCGTFKLYFDIQGFSRKDTIFLYDENCHSILRRIPEEEMLVNGQTLFKYRVEEQHYNYFAPTVWFDTKLGIVKVKSKTVECEESDLKIVSDRYLNKNALSKLRAKILTH